MTIDNSLQIISYDKLIEAIENDLTSNNFKTAAAFLIEALNDWPTLNLHEPSDLLSQVRKDVNEKLTYTNLENFSKQQDLGLSAWKVEAINALLEMFDFERNNRYDKVIELEAIIDKVTRHYSVK